MNGALKELLDHEEFGNFLKENEIDPRVYTLPELPRYLRKNPFKPITDEDLNVQLGADAIPSSWVDGFYSVSSSASFSNCPAYRNSQIYGLDLSSGMAVAALDPQAGDHVLDLCCAPGSKLCMIADMLGRQGSVTGVDVASNRLAAARHMLIKYGVADSNAVSSSAVNGGGDRVTPAAPWRCRLFLSDGCRFNVGSQEESAEPMLLDSNEIKGGKPGQKRVRQNKSSRARERKRQRLLLSASTDTAVAAAASPTPSTPPAADAVAAAATASASADSATTPADQDGQESQAAPPTTLYDRVLVDAECTHDASLRHLAKFRKGKSNKKPASTTGAEGEMAAAASEQLQQVEEAGTGGDSGGGGGEGQGVGVASIGVNEVKVGDEEVNGDGEGAGGEVGVVGWSWESFQARVLPPRRLDELETLQRGLISNGFRLLKPGGVMVYSTCSFCRRQNEDIVSWLLEKEPKARVLPIPQQQNGKEPNSPWAPGLMANTVRCSPLFGTSGLFIAKIVKLGGAC